MADELSGRELEIAVAKALGFEIRAVTTPTGFALFDKDGRRCSTTKVSEEIVWRDAPTHYLTDPADFAMVLAVLDESATAWSVTKVRKHGPAKYFAAAAIGKETSGATFQEAMCRAFVAWKQAQ